jgi:hypothetical protein
MPQAEILALHWEADAESPATFSNSHQLPRNGANPEQDHRRIRFLSARQNKRAESLAETQPFDGPTGVRLLLLSY